jgi:Undecaprenyl-phosphate glucose phosphotransferase
LLAALDAIIIVCAAIVSGSIYAELFYRGNGSIMPHVSVGLIAAALFVTVMFNSGGYGFAAYLDTKRSFRAVFTPWNQAFVLLALSLFLIKAGADVSRGAAIVHYVVVLAALTLGRHVLSGAVIEASKSGRLQARRIFLVGRAKDIAAFQNRVQPWSKGFAVVGTASFDPTAGGDGTAAARRSVDAARKVSPDDVILVVPWAEEETLGQLVDAFKVLPCAVEIVAPSLFERYEKVEAAGSGLSSFIVTRAPLSTVDRAAKRIMDCLIAGAALIALTPLFLVISFLIRRETPGPAFFKQKRNGFNQAEFWIYKFRTMRVLEDGVDTFAQTRRDDDRVTPLGKFLRSTSIDELPQLINVLLGHMSIVGPRPHAVKHNKEFEERIALYARRHNVKPGITGWAQIHGLRGETDTEQKMRDRVEHDLYYLDNWSLLLDIRIILMTATALVRHRKAAY